MRVLIIKKLKRNEKKKTKVRLIKHVDSKDKQSLNRENENNTKKKARYIGVNRIRKLY